MTEDERKKLNIDRLMLLDISIQSKIAVVLGQLEAKNLRPLIAKDVFRTPARQRELYNAGRTKVLWGFHNATIPGSKPPVAGSLAADIVDAELAWNAPQSFWLALGAAGIDQGLRWGGFFGLSVPQRDRIAKLFAYNLTNIAQRVHIGWDPAHLETGAVTIAEARRGKR